MKKKISKLFHEFVWKYNHFTRRLLQMFHKKKKVRILQNHIEEPVYLLFPDDNKTSETKNIFGFEGKEQKSSGKKGDPDKKRN